MTGWATHRRSSQDRYVNSGYGRPPESWAELAETLPLPAIDLADFQQPLQPPPAPPATSSLVSTGPVGLARVARGGALNLGGALISAIATLGLTVIVTQNFSRSIAGAFFVAMSAFLIVEAVANLGAYNGTIYFIARLRVLHAERRIPAIMRATIVPVVISSIVAAIAVIIFARPLAGLLIDGRNAHGVSPAAVASALRALAGALPFAALTDTLLGAARGYHEMRPTVVVDRIGRTGLQALGVLAAALTASSALLAPAWALPYVGASIAAVFWLRRIMRRQEAKPPGPVIRPVSSPATPIDNKHGKPNAKGFWSFTGPRSLASIAQIIIQRLDIVLVGVLIGPVEAAIYTAATRFLVAGQLGNAAISMAAQPQFTKLFAVGDRSGANAVYQATTAWLILLTWPLYLLAVIFGPYVLVIFGHAYHAGSTVMVILGLAMLVATACGQVDMVLITTGRSSWSLYNGLLAMVINVGVDLVLIPKLGITGAAIGWAAAIGITNLVPLVQVATAAKVHPFGPGTLSAALLATFSFAAIPLAVRELAGNGAPQVIASLAAGAFVLLLGLWLLRGPLQLAVLPLPKALRRRLRPRSGAGRSGSARTHKSITSDGI
ncbi:MAG TPA: polysaccharide biosynthesis C-terminal domain-containing protein [Streptosporangiaceae bacterium]|nr:polysaccharide biosynthesis C-terminal domain-containing protein [Streptosporangiaceae bacterium]